MIWTSLGQDGSREGVFGRMLQDGAVPVGAEFRANDSTISQQIYPAIGSDGSNRFLVSWSILAFGSGFDLFGRKYFVTPQE